MRKLGAIATGALLLAITASGASLAGTGPGGTPQTIRLEERTADFAYLDQGEQGPSLGDQIVFHGRLFDEGGERAGLDAGSCVQTSSTNEFHCATTTRLRGGSLTAQGLVRGASIPFVAIFAITGGTGEFADAGGQLRLEQVSEEQAHLTLNVIHLEG
jgi:allene oxide cyclase-like protein